MMRFRSVEVSEQAGDARIVLNVGGQKHETYLTTLKNIPDTRLAWISERAASDPRHRKEYFFDRNPFVFNHILNFYRTGKLHCPRDVCGPLFEEELAFWGIDDKQIESCCFAKFDEHREVEEKLRELDNLNPDQDDSEESDNEDNYENNSRKASWLEYQPMIWKTFEDPYSSKFARILSFVSLIISVIAVLKFCVVTIPFFKLGDTSQAQYRLLLYIEALCVTWFTIELIFRFVVCPSKCHFMKKIKNWIDLLALIPFYVTVTTTYDVIASKFSVLYVLRLTRTFRALKFSYVLNVFTQTLRASSRELSFLIFILGMEVVLLGSFAFYAESGRNGDFESIPSCIWWALITITTVGYGDMTPSTAAGKIVGSIGAISGVLMITLPVSVVASNFSLYNTYAKVKLKLPAKATKLMLASDLKALQLTSPQASVSVAFADGTTRNKTSPTFMRRGTIGGANHHEMTPLREGEEEEEYEEEERQKTLDNGPNDGINLPFANKRGSSRYRRGGIGTSILVAPDEKSIDNESDSSHGEKESDNTDKEQSYKCSQESVVSEENPLQHKRNPTKKTRFKCSQESIDKNSNHSTPKGSAKSSPAIVRRQLSRRGGLGLSLNPPNEVSLKDDPLNRNGNSSNCESEEHLNGDIPHDIKNGLNEMKMNSSNEKLKLNQIHPLSNDDDNDDDNVNDGDEQLPPLKLRSRAPPIENTDNDEAKVVEKESHV